MQQSVWVWEPLAIIGPLCLGAGGFLLMWVVNRIWATRHIPKKLADWLPELERANLAIVYSTAELAVRVKELVEMRQHMPPEAQRIADQVLHYTQLVEERLFEELADEGIVPRHVFGGPVSDLDNRPRPAPPTVNDVYDVDGARGEAQAASAAFRKRTWIGKHLLRR